jgi:hypothetical protein
VISWRSGPPAAFEPSAGAAACYAREVLGRLALGRRVLCPRARSGAAVGLLALACGDAGEAAEPEPTAPRPPLAIAAESWVAASAAEDPFVSESGGRVRCSPFAYRLEAGWLEVSTTDCNYATLVHHFAEDVRAGDVVRGEVAWATLASLEPAIGTLAFATPELGVLWTHEVSIPGEASIVVVELPFENAAPAGTALYFHVRNHGYNTWQLSPLERVEPLE